MAAIELDRVTWRIGARAILDRVSFTVGEGELLALIGPSGSGKSSALRMINRLLTPTSGTVRVRGRDVGRGSTPELRRSIGYVIQEVGLFPHRDVRRNVATVPELLGWTPARIRERVDEVLDAVGLEPDVFAHRFAHQLSGGQRQRVGIARAIAADPSIVLLDEPFSALDAVQRRRLQDEFLSLSRRLGKTMVFVTHDIVEAVRLAHRIVVVDHGRIEQVGTARQLLDAPASATVEALLAGDRFQLELACRTIDADVPASAFAKDPQLVPAEGSFAECTPDASLWNVLTDLAACSGSWVRVRSADGVTRWLHRDALLDVVTSRETKT